MRFWCDGVRAVDLNLVVALSAGGEGEENDDCEEQTTLQPTLRKMRTGWGTRRDLGGVAMHVDRMIVRAQILHTQEDILFRREGWRMRIQAALAQIGHDGGDGWASGIILRPVIFSVHA